MFSSLTMSYDIGDTEHTETLDDLKVTASPTVTGCPALEYSFTDQTGGVIDAAIFTYDSGPPKEFKIYSTDLAKSATYPLRMITNFIGYTNIAILDFQVTLIDTCETTTLTIANSMLSSLDITYDIGHAQLTETLDDLKVTASSSATGCPALDYSFTYQSGGATDASIFTYDSGPPKKFRIHSTDLAKSAVYLLRLTVSFIGYTNTATLDFQVTLIDTCETTTLTIASSMLTNSKIAYNIGSSQHIETLLDS